MSHHTLLAEIEQKREQLVKVATKNGLSSSLAIQYSQELDHLLNQYNYKYQQNHRPAYKAFEKLLE